MLINVDDLNAFGLSIRLTDCTVEDGRFFNPHPFDIHYLRLMTVEPGNHYYLLVDGEITRGYGMLRTFGKYPIPTLGCIIWPEHRNKGYGKALVNALLVKARELGYPSVRLRVHPENVIARHVYDRCGFKAVPPWMPGDEICMEYPIKETVSNGRR